MNIKQIEPKTLTLITTFKCTASCKNCCLDCNPNRSELLNTDFAIDLIEKCIKTFPSIKALVLTGGEAFLYFENIKRIIEFANKKGLICRVVTNGYWGTTKEKALSLLQTLKCAGLNEINFSTGDDHLKYVSISNIKNCIISALSLDLKTVINIESGNDRHFNVNDFNDIVLGVDTSKLAVIRGMWMPFTKETIGNLNPMPEKCLHSVKDRCSNLFSSITISPNNEFLSCCGLPVTYIKYLNLGKVTKDNLYILYKRQFYDFLKIWIFVEGPYKILAYIERQSKCKIPELRVLSHMCFYCACLFTNPQYLRFAQKYYKDKYDSVMIQFYLLTKKRF